MFAAITKQLFWAYVSRGDSAAAMAESKLLEHLDPTAQRRSRRSRASDPEGAGRTARVAQAREQGLDADTASSTANGKLLDLDDGRYVYEWKGEFKIYWESLIPDGHDVGHVGGKVAALERKGATILVRFQDELSSSDTESTDCYETNRIDGIDSSGKLIDRQKCNGSVTHVDRRKVEPVTMPANEAANLHAGDEIVGFAKGSGAARMGRVWLVKRGERVARLREMAL